MTQTANLRLLKKRPSTASSLPADPIVEVHDRLSAIQASIDVLASNLSDFHSRKVEKVTISSSTSVLDLTSEAPDFWTTAGSYAFYVKDFGNDSPVGVDRFAQPARSYSYAVVPLDKLVFRGGLGAALFSCASIISWAGLGLVLLHPLLSVFTLVFGVTFAAMGMRMRRRKRNTRYAGVR